MGSRRLLYVELALLLLIFVYDARMFIVWGSNWDNIAAYFNSLTMIGQATYYEILREPLIQLLIIPIALIVKGINSVMITLTIILSTLFFFSIKKLANSLKISKMGAYAISLSGIVIGFMTILNATDIFAAITVILALAYYYENKKVTSSVLFGLSFLAKFTNLIFLFYLPFIFKGKDLVKSLSIVFLINLPWFLANYIIYGNPFYGYLVANTDFSSVHLFGLAQLSSAIYSFFLLTYPFIIAIAVLALVLWRERVHITLNTYIHNLSGQDYTLLGIAILEYVYVGSAQNYVAWLGYPLYVALLVITLKILSRFERNKNAVKLINIVAPLVALAVIVPSLASSTLFYGTFLPPSTFSNNFNYPLSLNYSYHLNCSDIYSNAWPYLMVYNTSVKAVIIPNKPSVMPNIPKGACIIMFNTSLVGINANLEGAYATIFSSRNFSILKKTST